jgi:hypothetical protein
MPRGATPGRNLGEEVATGYAVPGGERRLVVARRSVAVARFGVTVQISRVLREPTRENALTDRRETAAQWIQGRGVQIVRHGVRLESASHAREARSPSEIATPPSASSSTASVHSPRPAPRSHLSAVPPAQAPGRSRKFGAPGVLHGVVPPGGKASSGTGAIVPHSAA